ncbi:40S ribosomal protein S27.2 [Garra rufa]|uniref:40S ribosomal protein S27.2 n=1 Tax=Garra rufa TaxID=137080 RepID=UPI003CCE6B4F
MHYISKTFHHSLFAGCYKITTVFSHAQTVVLCVGCSTVLCQPTGGKARLTEGCSFRRKQH